MARERWPDLGIPTYKESLLTQLTPIKKQEDFKEESLSDFDTDPAYIDSWFLTGDLSPESFRKKGFVGTSPEFGETKTTNQWLVPFTKGIME